MKVTIVEEEVPRVAYISGKMTGEPDLGRRAFNEMEEKLRAKGLVVLNPAQLPIGMPGDRYMPICMAMIDQCDVVVLLPGWQDSKGAKIEREYAKYQRKRIVYPGGGKKVAEK